MEAYQPQFVKWRSGLTFGAGLNRVRQAHQKARSLEEKDAKILKENFSSFSEVDVCLALGAGLNRVRQAHQKARSTRQKKLSEKE
nr:hypothetical protein DBT45_05175 [Aerococcus tenax]